ncbi:tetratricopeptide repeat-containing diguanylate cyclase [Shewanella gelidii]|uniref:GGDEF domain-containing protein n=1 Tax=Shewanella gelidii TaxID=1642821 RepID=A0A917NAG6_9GAMM|nr:hypothetical protein [Shewanella gelidii]MCL1098393.1 hypothetical protein [Shewanella gelidii]GGI83076.1 hypothetical protein GCM10009332_20450 [Shewanella gelidii]
MEFRQIVLCLLLWVPTAFSQSISNEDAHAQMDDLNQLIYQYADKAMVQISELEQALEQHSRSDITRLRLNLLKCEALMELGETKAAINVAQMGDAQAKLLRLEEARPYFLNCLADAHTSTGNLKVALPLFDAAIRLAKQYQQPQALVNALRQRGQIDTDTENFGAAIEDLRLALDIYPDLSTQARNWSWPPIAYIYGAMGNLFYVSGDLKQAIHYSNLAIQSTDVEGKVRHVLVRNAAKMHFDNDDTARGEQLLAQARAMMSQLTGPIDIASSYAIIASIDLSRGRLESAEQLTQLASSTFKSTNKKTLVMRSKRLLAQIKFAKGEPEQALQLMQEAIHQGVELKQFYDLVYFYQIMINHYADTNNYEKAFEYQQLQYQAQNAATDRLNDARFIQYKARLNQHDLAQTQAQQSISQHSQDKTTQLSWAYSIIFVLGMLLIAILIWYLINRSNQRYLNDPLPIDDALPTNQKLDAMLNSAKKSNSPMSLLLIDTGNIRQVDLPVMLDELKEKLREQDLLVRFATDQAVVVLPYTSTNGAEFVGEQLTSQIKAWQPDTPVNIGIASLQQFDTLPSMVRRASVNRLTKRKNVDSNNVL